MNGEDILWVRAMKLGAKYGCHQRPDRSFAIRGYQFPICARCTGMVLGTLFALPFALYKKLSISKSILMVIPLVLDGMIQKIGIKESTNMRRLVTGCIGGFGITMIWFIMIHRVLRALCAKACHFIQ